MESLLAQFTLLSNQALSDKGFDPSSIEDLMKLFEVEAYNSWAAAELGHLREADEAETELHEAEVELDSAMEAAMDEFRRFEAEMDRLAAAELAGLESTAERARTMGDLMEKAAGLASKRYVDAALSAATSSMRSAWKTISSKKIHPS